MVPMPIVENVQFQAFHENSYHFEPQSLISDQSLQNKHDIKVGKGSRDLPTQRQGK